MAMQDWIKIKNILTRIKLVLTKNNYTDANIEMQKSIKELNTIIDKYPTYRYNEGKDVVYFIETAYTDFLTDNDRQEMIRLVDKSLKLHNEKSTQEYFTKGYKE